MKRLLSTIAAAFAVSAPAAPSHDQWSFGPFSVDAFDGYTYKEGRSPAVYAAPNGSTVLITVHILEGSPRPDQMQAIQRNAVTHARDTFEKGVSKYGTALRPFSEEPLSSGDRLATLPVVTQEASGPGYLLQYAVIGKAGHIAIITVEGTGAASDAEKMLLSKVRTAKFKS